MKSSRIRERYKKVPSTYKGRAIEKLPAHGADVLAVCDLADQLEGLLLQIQLSAAVELQNFISNQLAMIHEP